MLGNASCGDAYRLVYFRAVWSSSCVMLTLDIVGFKHPYTQQPVCPPHKWSFHRSIGVRIMEEAEIIEGEVVEIKVRQNRVGVRFGCSK